MLSAPCVILLYTIYTIFSRNNPSFAHLDNGIQLWHDNINEEKNGEDRMRQPVSRIIAVLILFILFPAPLSTAMGENNAMITVPQISLAQQPIPDLEAMRFMRAMGVGWNLGNTFDAIKGDWNANAGEMTLEASWCGVYTTKEMIQAVHAAGFSTIRIPVSWHDHVSSDYQISQRWLDRVQQVVDWAMDEGMFVILNIHHDEDQVYPSMDRLGETTAYFTAVWEQLSERFQDYGDALIFESMNEPRLKDTDYEWNFNANAPLCRESAEIINQLNQLFVQIVRSSGGNNPNRYLMVPAYTAAPYNAVSDLFQLPKDSAGNRIIVSVHAYTPYNFALQPGGIRTFDLKKTSQVNEIIQFIQKLYQRYIVNGIPVIIGEFGARDKRGNTQARVDFTAYYTAAAASRNIPVVWWDNHSFAGDGENFGIFSRTDCTWPYPEILQALIQYGGYDKLPAKP